MRRIAALSALFAMLALAPSAAADTVEVNTDFDENDSGGACSLREAIAIFQGGTGTGCALVTAPGSDRITFDGSLTGATIDLENGELAVDVNDPLEITGPGMDSLTISAGPGARVLNHDAGSDLTISGLTISDGSISSPAGDVRGGCVLNGGELDLIAVRVTNCHATATNTTDVFADGGAIGNTGILALEQSVVGPNNTAAATNTGADNTSAQARGGGIYNDIGTPVAINGSSITENVATATDTGTGAAIATGGVHSFGELNLGLSTVGGNTATANHGAGAGAFPVGGIYSDSPTFIGLSTIAENIADSATTTFLAGGVFMQTSTLELASSTIARNGPTSTSTAVDGANLRADANAIVTVENTIVSNPRGGGLNCADTSGGTITSGGFNVDFSPAGRSCPITPGTGDLSTNPQLAAGLADNGGSTETLALQATSPAIDQGVNAAGEPFDQRGFDRPVDFTAVADPVGGDGSDIGAFEVQASCAGEVAPGAGCPTPLTPVTPATPGPTGERDAAVRSCKRKAKKKDWSKKRRKRCLRRARTLPI